MKHLLIIACIACIVLTVMLFHIAKEYNIFLCDLMSASAAYLSFFLYKKYSAKL